MAWGLLLLVLLAVLALCWRAACRGFVGGAAPARASPHVVVDLLNLTHHLQNQGLLEPGPLTACTVLEAVDYSASTLRQLFSGQVMYVTKDRESVPIDDQTRRLFQAAAIRHRVYIYEVDLYPDEHQRQVRAHGELGRDDFFMGLLAQKHRCGVLTADRMRDYRELRGQVKPFLVREYAPWRDLAARNQYNPLAREYAEVRRPPRLDYADCGL